LSGSSSDEEEVVFLFLDNLLFLGGVLLLSGGLSKLLPVSVELLEVLAHDDVVNEEEKGLCPEPVESQGGGDSESDQGHEEGNVDAGAEGALDGLLHEDLGEVQEDGVEAEDSDLVDQVGDFPALGGELLGLLGVKEHVEGTPGEEDRGGEGGPEGTVVFEIDFLCKELNGCTKAEDEVDQPEREGHSRVRVVSFDVAHLKVFCFIILRFDQQVPCSQYPHS